MPNGIKVSGHVSGGRLSAVPELNVNQSDAPVTVPGNGQGVLVSGLSTRPTRGSATSILNYRSAVGRSHQSKDVARRPKVPPILLRSLSSGGASIAGPSLRYQIILIESDMQISPHPALGQTSIPMHTKGHPQFTRQQHRAVMPQHMPSECAAHNPSIQMHFDGIEFN